MLSRIFEKVVTVMAVLAGLLLLFITFSISYSIFTRFVGIQSPVWTIQFNEYSLLWMTFLGTAWVLSRRKHVSLDIITGRFKHPAKIIMEKVHSLMGIGLCGVLFWYSFRMTLNLFQRGVTDVQAVDMPKYLILIVIPIGFLALSIQFIRNMLAAFTKIEPGKGKDTMATAAGESPDSKSHRDGSRRRDIS